ncbi:MAG: hypothetical protein D6797_09285 [Bdellovibrio sp.]|nr:MAG: hypothetical protein D6797_09285 [Bdellovibrio sp.]
MKRHLLVVLSLLLLGFQEFSSAAILVEEKGRQVQSYKALSSGEAFRQKRKVGVGMGLAGLHGLLGVQMELDFVPDVGVLLGYGVSEGFQTASVRLKKAFPGSGSALPYFATGLASWFRKEKKPLVEGRPHFFMEKFLSESQRLKGNFQETLLFGSAGLQYLQLRGPWVGTSFYAELQFLVDLGDFVAAPTGEIGFFYYF